MRVIIVALFLAVIASTWASHHTNREHFCGRKLAQTMAVICEKFYIMKKSFANDLDYSAQGWVQATRAMEMGGRGKRGVVDECCYEPCTKDYLMTYC